MHTLRFIICGGFLAVIVLAITINSAHSQTTSSVTTWHNDNWRTGQNTNETILKLSNVNKTHFGLLCKTTLLPQIGGYNQAYAQPLVIGHSNGSMSVYVATMNDYVYKFDVPANLTRSTCGQVASTSVNLLQGLSETPADCNQVGSTNCGTIAPTVGVLGTPVIDPSTNTIYLATSSSAPKPTSTSME
jgi:hypothetical protein